MVILHSLAHIKAGDMTDDASVLFLRVFYKVNAKCSYQSLILRLMPFYGEGQVTGERVTISFWN